MLGPEGFRPGDPRQIVDTRVVREVPFPEDPQARFEAIFAAIGNSEAKCVTLLVIQPHHPISGIELHNEFLDVTGGVWDSNIRAQVNYSNKSFIPNGLVEKVAGIPGVSLEHETRYVLTDAGIHFGQPIAAYLLQQSLELPHSLAEIFGQTSRHGNTRPFENRSKILEELYVRSSPARSTDLGDLTGLGAEGVPETLHRLNALNLIEYSSYDSEKSGQIKFRLAKGAREKPIPTAKRYVSLSREVTETIFDLGEADTITVAAELQKRFGREPFRYFQKVSMVLRRLRSHGILDSDFRGMDELSRIQLTEDGRRIVELVLLPIRKALEQGGEEMLREWGQISWQDYSTKGVARYKEQSGMINIRPQEEWIANTLSIVEKYSLTGIRPKEIEEILGHNPTRSLSYLIKSGQIRKERYGVIVKYYPT